MFGNEAQFSKGENHKTTRENVSKEGSAKVRRSLTFVFIPFLLKVFPFVSPFLIFFFLFPSLPASISYALTEQITITIVRNVQRSLFKKRLFRIISRLNLEPQRKDKLAK